MKCKTVQTYLVCPVCFNIAVIHRKYGRQKGLGHIKDLWCYRCLKVTKHVEYKTDYAAEHVAQEMRDRV